MTAQQSKPEIKTDYEEAKRIALAVMQTRARGNFPFNKKPEEIYPDTKIPEGIQQGTLQHALYLFHSVVLDSNRKATEVYAAALNLARTFDLSRLHEVPQSEIEHVLAGTWGMPKDEERTVFPAAKVLRHNSQVLTNKYGGDPTKIFNPNVWLTLEALSPPDFQQYGPGKAALLIKNMTRFRIWPYDPQEVPLKIDRHLMRVSLSNGVITNLGELERRVKYPLDEERDPKSLREAVATCLRQEYFTEDDLRQDKIRYVRSDKLRRTLMELYQKVTLENGISAIDLDDAFWAIGSNICNRNNLQACGLGCSINCPVRLPSDNNGVWFFTRNGDSPIDKRRGDPAFSFYS